MLVGSLVLPTALPPSNWVFPDHSDHPEDLVATGGDLAPETIIAAYRQGLFPMPVEGQLGWWSPIRRAVLPLDGLVVSRSLRRSLRRYRVTIDQAFHQVVEACADPLREHGWIDQQMKEAYLRLHALGWVHSVEAWSADGLLAGGLYGVAIGGFFAGESMFHRERDASKFALVHLVELLRREGAELLDVQWATPHLRSLGAVEIDRRTYLARLASALARPLPVSLAR